MKDLRRAADLSADDIHRLFDLAEESRETPLGHNEVLRDETVTLAFGVPSTRSRMAFETAIAHLGGRAVLLRDGDLHLGRDESIEDTARVLSRFARAVVVRTFIDEHVDRLAAAATIPVINGFTELHHPCAALAALFTLRRRFGSLAGLRVAYIGDGNRVAHSLLEVCAITGVDLAVATPVGYEPDAEIVNTSGALAGRSGSVLVVTHDPLKAVAGAHAVFTHSWLKPGDHEAERRERLGSFLPYRVDTALMRLADDDAVFLHPLPARRGEEVARDVIDGPRSLVFDQAENRLHIAQALLLGLLEGRFKGSRALMTTGVVAGRA